MIAVRAFVGQVNAGLILDDRALFISLVSAQYARISWSRCMIACAVSRGKISASVRPTICEIGRPTARACIIDEQVFSGEVFHINDFRCALADGLQ